MFLKKIFNKEEENKEVVVSEVTQLDSDVTTDEIMTEEKETTDKYITTTNSDIKVKLYTGRNIQGVTNAVLGMKTFANIDVVHCKGSEIDDILIRDILREKVYEKYDIIFITGLCLNDDSITTLNGLQKMLISVDKQDMFNFKYYIHLDKYSYLNNSDLNENNWAKVMTDIDGIPVDTATIFYKELQENYNLEPSTWLSGLVEKSRRYIKWEWIERGDTDANAINTLCFNTFPECVAKDLFRKSFIYRAEEKYIEDKDQITLNFIRKQYDEELEKKLQSILILPIEHENRLYKCGFVIADNFIDTLAVDLGKELKKANRAVDFIVIINNFNSISFRAVGKYDLDEILPYFNIKGHGRSVGSKIPTDLKYYLLEEFVHKYQAPNEDTE